MKEDVGIVIKNNYNIAVNFEYCLLLNTVPAENISTVNETEYSLIKNLPEFFKNRIETKIIKNILKK